MLRYTFELEESAAAAAADVRGAALAVASSAESVSEMNSSFIMCVSVRVGVYSVWPNTSFRRSPRIRLPPRFIYLRARSLWSTPPLFAIP